MAIYADRLALSTQSASQAIDPPCPASPATSPTIVRAPVLFLPLLPILLAILLWAGFSALTSATHQGASGPVYSIAALRAHLQHDPDAWLNRPLRVRALPIQCITFIGGPGSPCLTPQTALTDAGAPNTEPLPLSIQSTSSLLASLRRFPLLGRFLPAPQTVRWGLTATYDVQLHRVACQPAAAPCYAAVLADTAS